MPSNDLEKEVGEQPTEAAPTRAQRATSGLRSVLTGHASAALRTGSRVLARKGWGLLPNDGPWARLGYLGIGGYIAAYSATHAGPATPFVAPAAAIGWCIAAWTVSPEDDEAEGEEQPVEAFEMTEQAWLIYWLDRLTRGRTGIHLSELHQHLARHPDLNGLARADIRPWLEGHGITLERTLRVGNIAGRTGVSRPTIEALLKTLPPPPESSDSPVLESGPDLHESPDSPPGERVGEDHSAAPERTS